MGEKEGGGEKEREGERGTERGRKSDKERKRDVVVEWERESERESGGGDGS